MEKHCAVVQPLIVGSPLTTRYTNVVNVSRFFPLFTLTLALTLLTLKYPPDEIESMSPFVKHAYWFVIRISATLSSTGILMCCLFSFSSARLTANSIKLLHILTSTSIAFLCMCAYIQVASKIIVHEHGGVGYILRVLVIFIFICLAVSAFIYWQCLKDPSVVESQGEVSSDVSAISSGIEKDALKEVP